MPSYFLKSDCPIIELTGQDIQTFLQGQLSADVTQVHPHLGQLSLYCNLKGRVLAMLQVIQNDNGYALITHPDLVEPMALRLRKYTLMSQVDIHTQTVSQLFIQNPSHSLTPFQTQTIGQLKAIGQPDGSTLVYGDPDQIHAYIDSQPNLEAMDFKTFQQKRLQAGYFDINLATKGEFMPAELGLVDQAVSFKKGCFVGQEVIARLHYRGQLKKGLYCLETNHPISSLQSPILNAQGQAQGQWVDYIIHDHGATGIAVIKHQDANKTLFTDDHAIKAYCKLVYDEYKQQ